MALLAFLRPIDIVGLYPHAIINSSNETGFITISGILALLLAAWILSNRFKFFSNLTMTILVALTALINLTNLRLLFMLAPIFALALGLTVRYYPRIRVIDKSATPLV